MTSTAPSLEPLDPPDEIFAFKLADFPRVQRLLAEVLAATPAVALERSLFLTDWFEQNGFDPERPLRRQAQALASILERLTPVVFPEELLVGSVTEHRLGCVMFPEFQAAVIWPEFLKLPLRRFHPIKLSRRALEEFSFRIFPYFTRRNIHDWTKDRFGYDDSIRLMERMVFYLVTHPNGVSHLIPNYPIAVRRGFNAIREEASERGRRIAGADPASNRRRELYQAMALTADGAIALARNYARHCRELAAAELDPARMAELLESARVLERVPAEPAETFAEALQSLWITHVAVLQENSDMAVSFGRMDQFLRPLFERDLAEGRIDLKHALELILCLYVKTNDHTPLVPVAGERLFGGSATNQSITLGGLTPDGRDGVNTLSYLFLAALDLARLREPNVDVRFHPDSPDEWRRRALQVIRSTGAAPALYNDAAIVPALTSKGASLEDARDYGVVGCVETTVTGKTYPMTGSILLNLAAAFELALNDGVQALSGQRIGPATGRLRDFTAFEQAFAALRAQLQFLIDMSVRAETLYDRAHEELHPIPLLSSLIDGPMETGRDLTSGGALYNSSGVWVVGLADVADSLAALKLLVFDEKRVGAAELEAALAADFAGHEKIRAMCLHRAPKYGNDDPDADAIAVRLVETIDELYGRRRNYRGGPYHLGYWTMTVHTGYGRLTGALPNGRRAGRPLASGATPVSGAARKGPSAALSSTAKLPPGPLANCIANNHKIPASLLHEPGKMQVLEQLVRGFFRQGGMQVQFVVADRELLLRAMDDPELARDLLVRVSGYTAYFGDLDRDMQQEIVNRTEDSF